ncbi:NAD(P)H-dependent oxidoreductase subunit E, partial [Burkholderia contaminans]|uniref:NAD(P)H-dependent oxidoreductase subunit E n=1 Tax=Burkholderia contaminans TaxID=488447 RepID=UPI0018DD2712
CRFDTAHGDVANAHATADVALESVYCLGLCAQSPSLTVNGVLHAKVTPEKFDALLAEAVAQTPEAA